MTDRDNTFDYGWHMTHYTLTYAMHWTPLECHLFAKASRKTTPPPQALCSRLNICYIRASHTLFPSDVLNFSPEIRCNWCLGQFSNVQSITWQLALMFKTVVLIIIDESENSSLSNSPTWPRHAYNFKFSVISLSVIIFIRSLAIDCANGDGNPRYLPIWRSPVSKT